MMNVLSLFDGMSCGQIALNRIGLTPGEYYASEIDKHAIEVTQSNYPNTIQLGDINNWEKWDIDWSEISLIIAGSPCQGFSFSGKQLAFDDPRSKLFFTFVDILKYVKSLNPEVKFLLENVKMKKDFLNIISETLDVEPVFINSKLVSAQSRPRYYWTNIGPIEQPEDKNILLNDVLETTENKKVSEIQLKRLNIKQITEGGVSGCFKNPLKNVSKSECLMARDYKGIPGKQNFTMAFQNGVLRRLTPIEYERLQTVPDNYTACVSDSQRYKMLGNGWTVDVICHILKGLKCS